MRVNERGETINGTATSWKMTRHHAVGRILRKTSLASCRTLEVLRGDNDIVARAHLVRVTSTSDCTPSVASAGIPGCGRFSAAKRLRHR